MLTPENDLFYKSEDHPDWLLLKSKHSYNKHYTVEEENRIVRSYHHICSYVACGNTFMFKTLSQDSVLKSALAAAFYGALYFFSGKHRTEENDFFLANPKINIACAIWNLLDT